MSVGSKGKKGGILFSKQSLEFKEENGEFFSEGFVATTHKDEYGDILTDNAITKIVDSINNKFKPIAGSASERHDWLKEGDENLPLAGRAVVAEKRKTEDGKVGAFVRTHHHKFHPNFDEIKYNVENKYYPGYSIEFQNAKRKESEEGNFLEDLDLIGYGFANARMIANPHAEIVSYGYKELVPVNQVSKKNKGDNMTKKEIKEEVPAVPEVDEKKEEVEEKKDDAPVEKKDDAPVEEKEYKVSSEDLKLLREMKELKKKEAKMKELDPIIKERVSAEMKELLGDRMPRFNKSADDVEFKELDSYRKAFSESKELDKPMSVSERQNKWQRSVSRQYKEAARLHNALVKKGVDPIRNSAMAGNAEGKDIPFETDGSIVEMKELARFSDAEMKGLDNEGNAGSQTDTNLAHGSWTYGSYYQSPVELNDIYGPALVNQLNDQTKTFGRLAKDNFAGFSQIQFRARTGRNDSAGGYAEGTNYVYGTSIATGQVGRDKFQQPFAYYHVQFAVTGQAQRLSMAPGGMGDRIADEIKWSMEDLMVTLNQDVLGTGDGTSESALLGFEGLILGASGTLYARSLGSYTTLQSHKRNASSANISLGELRTMLRLVQDGSGNISSNANKNNLVFFTNNLQLDFIKAIMQDMQRIVPTSSRVGFEGEVQFDGVPIVADKDINTDDIFLIDVENTRIAMNLAPTIEYLPVTADATAGHIKTYLNLYSRAPANNCWTHTLATS